MTPNKKFKNFEFFQNSLNILNVTFGETTFGPGGNGVYFWGNNVYLWVFSKILGFVEFIFFVAEGGLGTLWVGGPLCAGVFENSNIQAPTRNSKTLNSSKLP